jgi:tyrosine-protein kinase Etk/Wzc
MTELNANTQSNAAAIKTYAPNDEIDIGKLLGELVDKKWLILAATLTCGFFGFVYGQLATPTFKSNAFIQVEDNNAGVFALDDIGDMFSTESSADTEIYILRSRSVLGKTVDDLNLSIQVEAKYFPIIGSRIARFHKGLGLAKPVFGDSYSWGGERVEITDFKLPKRLISQEFVLLAEGEQKFSLWFENKKLLTGVVGTYASNSDFGIKVDQFTANKGTQFTIRRNSRLNTILMLQREFRASNLGKDTGIMELSLLGRDKQKIAAILNSISDNYVSQNVQRLAAEAENSLSFINDQIPKIKASLNEAEVALNSYRAARESVNLSLETQSLLESFVKLEADISAMALGEADISRRYTKEHPNYVSFKRQQADLIGQRKRLNSKISVLPETQQKILRLMRDLEVNQAIYLSLQNKSQELAIVKASTVGNVRVLDEAVVFPTENSPKRGMIFALANILGAMASILFVLIRGAFNRGVSNPQEFQDAGIVLMGTIPLSNTQLKFDQSKERNRAVDKLPKQELLLSNTHPTDLAVEAIRSLRTSVHFNLLEAKNNIILISSAGAQVGKSFIAANLSAVLAKSGQKVLIVDADLRRGYLHRRFADKLGMGLSEYLRGSASKKDIIRGSDLAGLNFVSRWGITSNPSELLMDPKFKSFMEQAAKDYDLVVVDAPPILAVTDAAIIGQLVGITMMVARFEKSTVKETLAANERFRQNGIDVKGIIFNAIQASSKNQYSGYAYYNYSYESDSSKD